MSILIENPSRGFVLLVMIIFTFILFAMASSYLDNGMSEMKTSMVEYHQMQAIDLARAGAILGKKCYENRQTIPPDGLKYELPTGGVMIKSATRPNNRDIMITSTGYVVDFDHPLATASVVVAIEQISDSTASINTPSARKNRFLGYYEGEQMTTTQVEKVK